MESLRAKSHQNKVPMLFLIRNRGLMPPARPFSPIIFNLPTSPPARHPPPFWCASLSGNRDRQSATASGGRKPPVSTVSINACRWLVFAGWNFYLLFLISNFRFIVFTPLRLRAGWGLGPWNPWGVQETGNQETGGLPLPARPFFSRKFSTYQLRHLHDRRGLGRRVGASHPQGNGLSS